LNISITGGTGFVGREVTHELLNQGHRVRLISRSRPSPTPRRTTHPRLENFLGIDFRDPGQLAEAFRGTSVAIHLVGIIAECGPDRTFEHVHVDLTASALAAARAAGLQRWIHMSALGTRDGAASRYHRTKWAGEELVRRSGLDWTIFRPSLIHGARDGFTRLFARLSRWSPVLPVMGKGTSLLQPIAVSQVARAFASAVTTPDAVGRTYDLCGAERLTFVDVLRAILRAHGRRRWLLHIPMPVARLQAAVFEGFYPALLRRPPPLNRDQLLMLEEDNIGDGSAADARFGLEHRLFSDDMRRLAARECGDLAGD
jgi:NADH dehydrogenase